MSDVQTPCTTFCYNDFVAGNPEFLDLPCGVVESIISQARLMLDRSVWGKWWCMAMGLWIAHNIAITYDIRDACQRLGMRSPYDVGTTNNISASTNSLSKGSTTSAMLTSDNPVLAGYGRTVYGLRFLELLYTVIPAGLTVFSPDTSFSGRPR